MYQDYLNKLENIYGRELKIEYIKKSHFRTADQQKQSIYKLLTKGQLLILRFSGLQPKMIKFLSKVNH